MKYNSLNKIVSEYIKNNKFYISTIQEVEKISINILNQDYPIINTNEWSKNINLNDSIKIVYDFLTNIDQQLADQFQNIINQVDSNNNPIVRFIPKDQCTKTNNDGKSITDSCVTSDGIVYIIYEENPNDVFVILHEMMHKMNESWMFQYKNKIEYFTNELLNKPFSERKIELGQKFETITRDYFGEAVSITSEMILGEYLVSNEIITENDFNLRKTKRLNGAKQKARDFIINANLINMKLNGIIINYDNLEIFLSNFDKKSPIYKILLDESHDQKRINNIIKNQNMDLEISQRYVIGQYISNQFIKSQKSTEELIKLHNAISNKNINEVIDEIKNNHPTL